MLRLIREVTTSLWANIVIDSRPDLEIVVRNEAGRLTMECVGQKVELFPKSETDYFVKQFYGEVSFHRDREGKIAYLDFVMRVPNSAGLKVHRLHRLSDRSKKESV